ncbi:MAG TPA: outer membrane protein assembly factor BamC [Burkholderiaceae bacterium]|nr:outer membrane protein assembly factor BamC [Burkholderiaceae bacterium]
MQPPCSRKTSAYPALCLPAYHRDAPAARPALLMVLLGTALACGCSTVGDALSPARVDYRSEGARSAPPLDVPPDLTQLGRDLRYQPPAGGTVTATALQTAAVGTAAAAATTAATSVSPSAAGKLRIDRAGSQRWLASPASPEELWPKVREFWTENGFPLETDKPEVGIMETGWAANRAKLPQDFIRRTLGRLVDNLYDSGERDRYRTRMERVPSGTEIYISHRGMAEVAVGNNDATRWQSRGADPELEAEMLTRLMLKLSGQSAAVVTAAAGKPAAATTPETPDPAAAASNTPARARAIEGRGTPALQVDEGFDRAWRRVGLALDRSGFTVEDRDRNAGIYFVRYVDPKFAGKEEPGMFARLFGAKPQTGSADRYRVVVKAEGTASIVTVLDSLGAPKDKDNESAQRIVQLLVADLR